MCIGKNARYRLRSVALGIKKTFTTHDLGFPLVFNSRFFTIVQSTLLVLVSCSFMWPASHGANYPPLTFATLWLLPFLPAFGPGLNSTSWYRLILRKEDQPTLYSPRYPGRGSASIYGYSGPFIWSTSRKPYPLVCPAGSVEAQLSSYFQKNEPIKFLLFQYFPFLFFCCSFSPIAFQLSPSVWLRSQLSAFVLH
ncbi:hypothetical protein BJX68DRAFT_51652 [Aspergillus pseudodeflectus]|uniref:Uncharacterized protein n=1 Tax=Aspergillus pseudodeflectus TaxID=176178 RepID=A0ABR4KLG1_9EURO